MVGTDNSGHQRVGFLISSRMELSWSYMVSGFTEVLRSVLMKFIDYPAKLSNAMTTTTVMKNWHRARYGCQVNPITQKLPGGRHDMARRPCPNQFEPHDPCI